jgi:ribosome-binding protein aMBF1 (putative translation factor)
MEAGEWDPRLSTLKKLAKTLGVTVAELIGEKPRNKKGG